MASQERILEAARGEFALRGYSARLQDIAERAGLTHPTLLYHFGSKERLYAAVIEQAMLDWRRSPIASSRSRRWASSGWPRWWTQPWSSSRIITTSWSSGGA